MSENEDEKLKYLKQIYNIHTDWWKFLKSHVDAKNQPDKWWDVVMMEAQQITDKYAGTELKDFACKQAVETLSELQAISKGERF